MMEKESKCPRGVYKVKTYGTLQRRLNGEILIRAKSLAAISISIILHELAGIFWQGFAGQSRSFHCALPFLHGGFYS